MIAILGAGPNYSERMTLYVATKQLGISPRSAAAERYQDHLCAASARWRRHSSDARVIAMCLPL